MFLNTGGKRTLKTRPINKLTRSSRTPRLLILDGQQRLSSLFYAFYDIGEEKFYIDLEELKKDNVSDDTFYYYNKKVNPLTSDKEFEKLLLPVSAVFNEQYDFEDWYDDYVEYCSLKEKEQKIKKGDYKLLKKKYITLIKQYEFPILELPENTGENIVCEIFEVLNRTGTPLNVFELLTAKLWTKKIHLRDLWDAAKKSCPKLDLFGIDSVTFLRSLSLLSNRDTRAAKSEYLYKLSPKHFDKYWEDLIKAYNELFVTFLNEFGIVKGKWIPYKLLAPVMAALLVEINQKYPPLEKAKHKEKLILWFWRTTFFEHISRYTESRAGRDFSDIITWIEKKELPWVVDSFSINEDMIDITKSTQAFYRGVINLLVLNGAKDFHTKNLIKNQYELDNSIDDHHVFPRAMLLKLNVDNQKMNSVINRTLIDGLTNKSI